MGHPRIRRQCPDANSESATADQALALDQQAVIDVPEQSMLDGRDGSETHEVDAPMGEAAWPSPVPDAGMLLFDDFEDGTADGWKSADWNEAGTADHDWSVFLATRVGSIRGQPRYE